MSLRLDTLEQRIVGVLVEKQLTVPDAYPLTLNALVAGCNQKNNREPKMEAEDFEVEGALRSLMDRGWVRRVEREGGRTMRYAHQAKEQLGLEEADLAILSELLCRGPQSAGTLKTRAARMHAFQSPASVEDRLRQMASRPSPYVVELPRRPREQANRWRHLLDGADAADAASEAPGSDTLPSRSSPGGSSAPRSGPGAASASEADLAARVEALEHAVRDLEARLDALE